MVQSSLVCSILFVSYFCWFSLFLFQSHSDNVFLVTRCSELNEIVSVMSHRERHSHFSLIPSDSLRVVLISFIAIPHNIWMRGKVMSCLLFSVTSRSFCYCQFFSRQHLGLSRHLSFCYLNSFLLCLCTYFKLNSWFIFSLQIFLWGFYLGLVFFMGTSCILTYIFLSLVFLFSTNWYNLQITLINL